MTPAYWLKILPAFLASIVLTACPLLPGDQERIEQAEDNLQKVALDPKILEPSDDEMVSGVVDVIVDVDDSVEYEKVALQIGAQVVAEDFAAPFEFELDTYFLASEERITLLAKAFLVDGTQLRSDVVTVEIDPYASGSLYIKSPSLNETYSKESDVTIEWTEVPSAASYEVAVNDFAPIFTNESFVEMSFDEVKRHSVKVRAYDEEGNAGVWTESRSFATGLFALAVDVKKFGYSSNDDPIDFLIDGDDFVLLSSGSDLYSDGSGDSYNPNLMKISHEGDIEWHRTYGDYRNPSSLSKTSSGYLVVAKPEDWYSGVVFETNENGFEDWAYIVEGVERDNIGSDFTREYVGTAIEFAEDKFLISRETTLYEQYKQNMSDSYYQSRIVDFELDFDVVDGDLNTVTSTTVTQPVDAVYDNVNQMLHSSSGLFAAGQYELDAGGNDGSSDGYINTNGSGTVVFSFDPDTGEFESANTRTGGGLANNRLSSLAEDASNNLFISYDSWNQSFATYFLNGSSVSDYINTPSIIYSVLAANTESGGFALAGRDNNYPSNHSRIFIYDQELSLNRAISLWDYSRDLRIRQIRYDDRYGYVVLASEEGSLNSNAYSYTVIFNVSEEGEFISPAKMSQ